MNTVNEEAVLPPSLKAVVDGLCRELPALKAATLPAYAQDLLLPGQDIARACPQFLARLILDPSCGLIAVVKDRALMELCVNFGEYFAARSQWSWMPGEFDSLAPSLLREATQDFSKRSGAVNERRVLRALRLLWATQQRGPRCQALAAKACRRAGGARRRPRPSAICF